MRNKHLVKFAEEHGVTRRGLAHVKKCAFRMRLRGANKNEWWKVLIILGTAFNKKAEEYNIKGMLGILK